jgi:hypothetical protein
MIDPLWRLIAIEEIKQPTFCRYAVWDCSRGFQYTPLDGDPIGPVGHGAFGGRS